MEFPSPSLPRRGHFTYTADGAHVHDGLHPSWYGQERRAAQIRAIKAHIHLHGLSVLCRRVRVLHNHLTETRGQLEKPCPDALIILAMGLELGSTAAGRDFAKQIIIGQFRFVKQTERNRSVWMHFPSQQCFVIVQATQPMSFPALFLE